MPLRLFVAVVALAAVNLSLTAQESFDRRSRHEPEVLVRDGGRSGSCDAVRFSPDGKHLFAAGDDKVVSVWPHAEKTGLSADPPRVLLWPVWREQRGGIKDIAVSPDGKRVLVGGYGVRKTSVAVLDADPAGREMQLTWPDPANRIDFGTVEAVAFSPDGKTAAFGTRDGGVWVWLPVKQPAADKNDCWYNRPLWVGRHPQVGNEPDRVRRVFFRGPDKLVSVSGAGEVRQFDVAKPEQLKPVQEAAPARTEVLVPLKKRVFHAAYDPTADTLAVAVDAEPLVIVRPLDAKQPEVTLDLPKEHFARTVAVHKDGAVAVAVGTVVPGTPQFHNDADDTIRVYRNPTAGAKPDVTLRHGGQAEALAFHPTLDRLAVGGGEADEVSVYDLGNPANPPSVARGSGRRAWQLALSVKPLAVGMRTKRNPSVATPNGRGAGEWEWLDLTNIHPLTTAPANPVTAVETADGWTVEPDSDPKNPNRRDQWYATHADLGRLRLDHDAAQFNKPTCYTFLKAADGRPTRLLVGHLNGATLYELPKAKPPKGATLPPARVYVGHAGEVLSVAAVDDAKGGWFVTAASDHTVAAYNLAPWPSNPGFGATFVLQDGRPVVAAVDTGSPGWEAGLRKGDVVEHLAVNAEEVYAAAGVRLKDPWWNAPKNAAERNKLTDPKRALDALAAPHPGRELLFELPGGAVRQTSVKQRPLWKLYPSFNRAGRLAEWVVWMWKGSYYAAESSNADRLVGWQLNGRTSATAPAHRRMSDYHQLFAKPEVVKELIANRNVAEALEKVLGKNPQPRSFDDTEPAPPRVGVDRTRVTDQPVVATVKVARRPGDVDLLPDRVELWLNDYRFQDWAADPAKEFERVAEIPPGLLRAGENRLTVRTYNGLGGTAEGVSETITNLNPAAPPTLHGLSVGVNDYRAHREASGVRGVPADPTRGVVGDLKYAVADAEAVAATFRPYTGKGLHFAAGKLGVKTNDQVAKKGLLRELSDLRKTARPDDLLVLFLAGHGQLVGDGATGPRVIGMADDPGRFKNVRFAFCCPNFNTAAPADAVIFADELYRELAGLNCRKVVLLDVCRSGWATRQNVVKMLVPEGQGAFVMAACQAGQESHEVPKLKHGLFTAAVLEATTRSPAANAGFHDADTDRDGRLSCRELFEYVERRVGEERRDQTPTCFPDRLRLPQTTLVAVPRK